ncbi:MAG TPA: hypothetical protein ENI23_13685 [bacterium]|nr:hypothetical protein [bacterium]
MEKRDFELYQAIAEIAIREVVSDLEGVENEETRNFLIKGYARSIIDTPLRIKRDLRAMLEEFKEDETWKKT